MRTSHRFGGFDTRKLSLTAALAAIYTIFRLIPISRLIGINGSITASGMVIPIIGTLVEPEYGVLAIFIGTMVASFSPLNPLRFAGLDFIPGAMNLVAVSLALRGRRLRVSMILLTIIALFALTPNTRIFVGSNLESPPLPFFWLHLLALGVLASPLSKNIVDWLQTRTYSRVAASIGIAAFGGAMIEHLSGGILFAFFLGPGAARFWPAIYLVYPIERTLIVAGAVLISTPFILTSRGFRGSLLGRIRPISHGSVQE